MAISIYQCDTCKFTFERASEVENCPDCGGSKVRFATEAERERYSQIKAELAAERSAGK